MRRELARLAQEIDYVPQAHALVQTKPMTVRRALVGAAAVFMCLLLLPIAVFLLRGSSQGLTGQESAETSPAAAETAEPAVTEGVTFRRGDRTAQYDSLAACLDQEMPDLYYPTVFPDGMKPTSVTVTEEGEEVCTTIGFGDTPYFITVRPWSLLWLDWQKAALENGCDVLTMYDVTGIEAYGILDAYEKIDEDGNFLAVRVDSTENGAYIYEFRTADEETVCAMFISMRNADSDHVHAWDKRMAVVELEDGSVEKRVFRFCKICP